MELHSIVASFQRWLEGCSCHEHLRAQDGGASFQAKLKKAYVDPTLTTSPLAGCQAPDLACDKVSSTLELLADASLTRMMQKLLSKKFTWLLSSGQPLEADFQVGKHAMSLVLSLKCHRWNELPWLIHGLCHHDRDKAAVVMELAAKQYDASEIEVHSLSSGLQPLLHCTPLCIALLRRKIASPFHCRCRESWPCCASPLLLSAPLRGLIEM